MTAPGREVLIVPTGTANIASVMAAFARADARPRVAEAAAEIEAAGHVMLPGVGAFGAAMQRLRSRGFDAALLARMAADRPTICICVGHQLLFRASMESPGEAGLGLIAAEIGRFEGEVRVPQFGWNEVRAAPSTRVLGSGYAYFANSYRALQAPGWAVAEAEHGGAFVAGVERGRVVGCQFHPELSGTYGAALLRRFLELEPC
jgi:glutamine amidotransferase